MGDDYTFSCYVKRQKPVLVRRPWWNIFGRDRIQYREECERVVFPVNQLEAELLIDGDITDSQPWRSLFRKALGYPIHVQLEYTNPEPRYIKTKGGRRVDTAN